MNFPLMEKVYKLLNCFKKMNNKRKLQRREYYLKNKEKEDKQAREWKERNRERYLKTLKDWREKHAEYNKECLRKYYLKNRERLIKKSIEWRKKNKEKYKGIQNKAVKKYAKNNKTETNARLKALRNIKIPKNKICENCKKQIAIERHHEDYNKQLKVKYLCLDGHKKIHRKW